MKIKRKKIKKKDKKKERLKRKEKIRNIILKKNLIYFNNDT